MRRSLIAVAAVGGCVASSVSVATGVATADTPPCSFTTHNVRVIWDPPGRATIRFVNRNADPAYVSLLGQDDRGPLHTKRSAALAGDGGKVSWAVPTGELFDWWFVVTVDGQTGAGRLERRLAKATNPACDDV